MSNLIWFLIGVVIASLIWFFVWRNNKARMTDAAEHLDSLLDRTGLDSAIKFNLERIKEKLNIKR